MRSEHKGPSVGTKTSKIRWMSTLSLCFAESKWNSKQCRLTGWKSSSRRCQQKLACWRFNRITTTATKGLHP